MEVKRVRPLRQITAQILYEFRFVLRSSLYSRQLKHLKCCLQFRSPEQNVGIVHFCKSWRPQVCVTHFFFFLYQHFENRRHITFRQLREPSAEHRGHRPRRHFNIHKPDSTAYLLLDVGTFLPNKLYVRLLSCVVLWHLQVSGQTSQSTTTPQAES